MRNKMTLLVVLTLGTFLNGCTNYLYQGSIKAEDSAGKQRQVVLYWSKTDPLIGDAKADMVHLLTECGSLIVFENQPDGIIFRGEPQRDRVVIPRVTTNDLSPGSLECGRIKGAKRVTELSQGEVALTIQCEPKSSDFAVRKRTYLKAREMPYTFDVSENKRWNLLGSTPAAPQVPTCRE